MNGLFIEEILLKIFRKFRDTFRTLSPNLRTFFKEGFDSEVKIIEDLSKIEGKDQSSLEEKPSHHQIHEESREISLNSLFFL